MAGRQIKGVVGVLFSNTGKWFKGSPFKIEEDEKAYALFARKARKHSLKVVFAHYKEYRKGGILRRAWKYDKGWKRIVNHPVDLVYVRFNGAAYKRNRRDEYITNLKYAIQEDISAINHPELEEFCWDKRIVTEVFPEYCPKSFIVNTLPGLKTVLSDLESEKIVLKPRYGSLGKKVQIINKAELPEKVRKNTLVQEFIDTTKGVKGIADCPHDLRVIVINGKIDHAHVRLAKEGSLIANMSLGGTKKFVPVEDVPKEAIDIVKRVDKLLKNYYPRLYSVDFIFNPEGRPYIVECNSSPVIKRYAYGEYRNPEFFDRILEAMAHGIKIKVENKM